ncbi:MAG: EAL domain-containing protein [Noviherbaspirillum sp.]
MERHTADGPVPGSAGAAASSASASSASASGAAASSAAAPDLRESEEGYRKLLAHMPEGFALGEVIRADHGTPVDFRLIEVNDAFQREASMGCAVVGRPAREWLPDTEQSWIARFGAVALTGIPAVFEVYKPETGRHYEVHAFSPGAGRFAVLLHDVTSRKRIEQVLRDSEQVLRATFEQAAVGITHVGPDGFFLRVNRKFADMLGMSEEEIYQTTIMDVAYAEDREIGIPEFRQLVAGEIDALSVEKRCQRKDGSIMWARITGSAIRDRDSGAFKFSVAVIEDITARKQAEEALQRERSQLQAILDNAPLLVTIKDPQGKLVLANRALFEQLDVPPPEQCIGRSVFEIFPRPVAERSWANDREALRAVAPVRAEEIVCHRDGSWHTYLTVKFPMRNPGDDQPYGVCAISTDITERKQAEQERERLMEQLRDAAVRADQSRAKLETVFQSIGDGIAVFDMERNLVVLNNALARISGFLTPEKMLLNLDDLASLFDACLPDGTPLTVDEWPASRVLRGETINDVELIMRRRDNRRSGAYSYSGAPVCDEHGKQILAVVVIRDVTGRKRLEQARLESERRLQLAVAIAHLGFWEWDLVTDECYFSPQWKKQLGYEEHELDNSVDEWKSRLHSDDRERALAAVATYLAQPGADFRSEYRLRHRDGSYRWMIANAVLVSSQSGQGLKLTGTQLDVTERKLAEQRVLQAAQHDALTGLPNRALVFEYAGHLVAAALRNHGHGAFLFIDLDRFKPVNDLYGHDVGDRLLQEVARRLLACVRKEDLVGRLGGDEFIIVLPYTGERVPASTVAQHVLDKLSLPFEIDTLELSISASIGISHFPQHGSDVDALIHAADLAMYQTKQGGRGYYHIYTAELESNADASSSIEARLKRALQRDGLALHYQPVIDIRTGVVTGAEALLRLTGEDGRMIGPERFVPIAESAGLIGKLGEWVATEACRQHQEWCRQGLTPVSIAINVSPLQFRQRGFAQRLQEIVQQTGIDPSRLQIEVTESTVMESVDEAIQTLNAIRASGIRIALDDFGTGYSSLSRLSHLPLDKLKVDQSFVRRLAHDHASRAIVGAIIALGRMLNLEVVGEGIESADALAYLHAHGCDQAQGFWIGPPMPADDFARWYREKGR